MADHGDDECATSGWLVGLGASARLHRRPTKPDGLLATGASERLQQGAAEADGLPATGMNVRLQRHATCTAVRHQKLAATAYIKAEKQRLPCAPPTFPVVSLVDPHAISFLLMDDKKDLYWIIDINMKKKALRSPASLYINTEEEEECCSDRRLHWKYLCGHYFIPSWFTSYSHEDPIQSRKESEAMQKAKQESTMHKIGWIERKQRIQMLRQEREKKDMEMLNNIDWKLMEMDPMLVLRSLWLSH